VVIREEAFVGSVPIVQYVIVSSGCYSKWDREQATETKSGHPYPNISELVPISHKYDVITIEWSSLAGLKIPGSLPCLQGIQCGRNSTVFRLCLAKWKLLIGARNSDLVN
jgi:hypothetical protein